jgi:hypothetical protein
VALRQSSGKRPQWIPLPPPWKKNSALKIDSVQNHHYYDDSTIRYLSALSKPGTPQYEYMIDRLYFVGNNARNLEYSILTLRYWLERYREVPASPLFEPEEN